MESGVKELRSYGVMELWSYGVKELRSYGVKKLRSYGVKTIQKPCYKSDSLIEDNHTNQKGCAPNKCAPFLCGIWQ